MNAVFGPPRARKVSPCHRRSLLSIFDGRRRAVVAASIRRAAQPAFHITKISHNQVRYLTDSREDRVERFACALLPFWAERSAKTDNCGLSACGRPARLQAGCLQKQLKTITSGYNILNKTIAEQKQLETRTYSKFEPK
jgi:hypothetical protein